MLYAILIRLFYLGIVIVSPFHRKARLWIKGRTGWARHMPTWKADSVAVYWFHAASLGEFEQGRPLMEAMRKREPHSKLLLTFFSPSGFEVRKNFALADHTCYLPLDTARNARLFVRLVQPRAVFFIKYEFWYYYLRQLHLSGIPLYLVSGIFRPGQPFFHAYGQWFRNKLGFFSHFYVQDQASANLLASVGFRNVTVTGDTRFDRVTAIMAQAGTIEPISAFSAGSFCMVAGSTWPPDEALLVRFINQSDTGVRLILAPHDIRPHHISRLMKMITRNCIRYSETGKGIPSDCQVLVIDNVGMLSSLYRYGRVAYIGGGFGAGIHNTLEPAAAGLPVIFGPKFRKFREAVDLINIGGAYPVRNYREFNAALQMLRADAGKYNTSVSAILQYVSENTGATERILQSVFGI